ncbi:MAG: alanine racemase [Methylophilaceae bacterium]
MRPIQAIISHSALQHNLNVVKQHAPRSKIMSVVKANGYGHGLINVAHGLNATNGFAVLNLNEAVDLREAGFEQTILLLEGVFIQEEMKLAAAFGLDTVVHAALQIDMLEQVKLARPMHVHLKMNTGMNRLGFMPSDYVAAFARLKTCKNVAGITLMTHFATADEARGIAEPLQRFQSTIKGLKQPISLANSAAIMRHSEAHADWVRPGIMLYGATPVSGTPAVKFNLKAAMQLTSEIIAVQAIQAGESVGYGHCFTATKNTRVGVVACGYADGYPRHALNGTPIAVAGKRTQTLGRVSMDMLFCDLTDIPEANIGAPVELWGSAVPVDAIAEASATVGYELLCAVSPRVPMKVVT